MQTHLWSVLRLPSNQQKIEEVRSTLDPDGEKLKTVIVRIRGNSRVTFLKSCGCTSSQDGNSILWVYGKDHHEVIAQFSAWECWYFKEFIL